MSTSTEARQPCDTCRSGPWCQNLKTVLALVRANRGRIHDASFLALIDAVELRLRLAGWRYPDARTPCGLAGSDRELRAIIDRLIERWSDHCAHASAPGQRSLYHDETHRDS